MLLVNGSAWEIKGCLFHPLAAPGPSLSCEMKYLRISFLFAQNPQHFPINLSSCTGPVQNRAAPMAAAFRGTRLCWALRHLSALGSTRWHRWLDAACTPYLKFCPDQETFLGRFRKLETKEAKPKEQSIWPCSSSARQSQLPDSHCPVDHVTKQLGFAA